MTNKKITTPAQQPLSVSTPDAQLNPALDKDISINTTQIDAMQTNPRGPGGPQGDPPTNNPSGDDDDGDGDDERTF